jgi:predicted  nucleic acid-binding Zn-ribbon protein
MSSLTPYEHACRRVDFLEGELSKERKKYYSMEAERDAALKKVENGERRVAGLESELRVTRQEYFKMRDQIDTLLKQGQAHTPPTNQELVNLLCELGAHGRTVS